LHMAVLISYRQLQIRASGAKDSDRSRYLRTLIVTRV